MPVTTDSTVSAASGGIQESGHVSTSKMAVSARFSVVMRDQASRAFVRGLSGDVAQPLKLLLDVLVAVAALLDLGELLLQRALHELVDRGVADRIDHLLDP